MLHDLSQLVAAAARDDDRALTALEEIAAADPGRLTPHLRELLEHHVWWPPRLYRGADAGLVEMVIARVNAGGLTAADLNHLLLILAVTGHDLAVAAFRTWRDTPPPDADRLHVPPEEYVLEGGWCLAADGSVRGLCSPVAHELVMTSTTTGAAETAVAGTAVVGTAVVGTAVVGTGVAGGGAVEGCPWCDSPLLTLLDLDTATPAVAASLAHTGWSGRLRLATCFQCVCLATLYTSVAPDGEAIWSPANRRPDYLPCVAEQPPPVLPTAAGPRSTPYLASAWERGGSTLGGHPDWIQEAEYPRCASCGQIMDYIGLVNGADLYDGEGATYLFLHAACGLAAANYQQS